MWALNFVAWIKVFLSQDLLDPKQEHFCVQLESTSGPVGTKEEFLARLGPGYAFAPRTFLKEKYIFVLVCISCLKKVLHLLNIFLLNIHFSVCDEKKRKKNKKHDVSSFQQQKQRKQREVSKKTTTFLQSTFTNITTCRRQNER